MNEFVVKYLYSFSIHLKSILFNKMLNRSRVAINMQSKIKHRPILDSKANKSKRKIA